MSIDEKLKEKMKKKFEGLDENGKEYHDRVDNKLTQGFNEDEWFKKENGLFYESIDYKLSRISKEDGRFK